MLPDAARDSQILLDAPRYSQRLPETNEQTQTKQKSNKQPETNKNTTSGQNKAEIALIWAQMVIFGRVGVEIARGSGHRIRKAEIALELGANDEFRARERPKSRA